MKFEAYNENGELQSYEIIEHSVTCKKCGREYLQEMTEQIPGFRESSEDVCPYCENTNRTSMSFEFDNYKIDED